MRKFAFTALMISMFFVAATAAAEPWNDPVIKGYDPVAFFTEEQAVPGKAAIASTHAGGTFWFASEEHRRTFEQNPGKYVPQFGGFCALGVTQGRLLDVDPEAFTVYKDRLYLNGNKKIRETWRKNKDENIRKAKEHWPDLYGKRRQAGE